MELKTTGGPAFPCDEIVDRDNNGNLTGFPITIAGMSLRDYFAGQIISNSDGSVTPEKDAAWAYRIADAMIAERSK